MAAVTPTFREYMAQIAKGNFPSVNILMGEEPYYLDVLVKAFESHVVDEADRDFNYNVFYGQDADLNTVAAAARQFPVMAPRKLVILKEAQSMNAAKAQLDRLAPYVESPSPSTVFVIVFKGEMLNATSKLLKAAASAKATVFKSPEIKDYQLPGPVKDYCTSKKIGIDDKAVSMLCEYIGAPLAKLFGEIDKLILSLPPGAHRITPVEIENGIGVSKDFNNFELQTALSRKDYNKAMKIVKYFADNPKANPTVMTTGTIFSFFQKLLILVGQPDRSESGMMRLLDMKNRYQLKDYNEALRHYNLRQTVYAIHAIRDFDARSKGIDSFQNEHELLRELIFSIMTH